MVQEGKVFPLVAEGSLLHIKNLRQGLARLKPTTNASPTLSKNNIEKKNQS